MGRQHFDGEPCAELGCIRYHYEADALCPYDRGLAARWIGIASLLLLFVACGTERPTEPLSCAPGAECELGMPISLAHPSEPDVDPGTRIAASPLDPGPYVILAWACESLPGGDPHDAVLHLDPGLPGAQQVAVPTPPCSATVAPVRWQGVITAGVNLVNGAGVVPPGTRFSAVVLAFPVRGP